MLRFAATCVISACAATASAQQWAEQMFSERTHDFGSVPRSAKVEHEFVMTNLYKDDVHIAGVRSSCGCTQPRILKDTLKTHEKGAIIAAFNTHAFSGQRGARVTVTIDRPKWAEIQLQVHGYIRTDLTLEPGEVNLGSVPEGKSADKKIQITHYGNSDWKITEAKSNSPHLEPTLREVSRSGGRVTYELAVALKDDAPAGYLNDQLVLTTNDRSGAFPVMVEGRVVAPLTVSPTALMIGSVVPGQKLTKQIVVKGTEPFAILDVQCDDPSFTFDLDKAKQPKTVHLLPVTYTAGNTIGKFTCQMEIITDLGDSSTTNLTVIGHINPVPETQPLATK
jgi:hypothetical protein